MAKLKISDFRPFHGRKIRTDGNTYEVRVKTYKLLGKVFNEVVLCPIEGKCYVWPIEVLHGDSYFAEQVLQELHNAN